MDIRKNILVAISTLLITLIICVISMFIYGYFFGKVIFDNFTNDGRESFLGAITLIGIVSTTILSGLLYLATLKSNKINENIVDMTNKQNDIQNYLVLNEKRRETTKNTKNIEKYIKSARVLDLFCYTNFSQYYKWFVLKNHKRKLMVTELNPFIDLNTIHIPKLSAKEEKDLKSDKHDKNEQVFRDIESEFSNLLPKPVVYDYNVKYLKDNILKLIEMKDDELISMYEIGKYAQGNIENLELNYFREIFALNDNETFYNAKLDHTSAEKISKNLVGVKTCLNDIIRNMRYEYEKLEKQLEKKYQI